MKDLVFCYTFSMKTMKLMPPPKYDQHRQKSSACPGSWWHGISTDFIDFANVLRLSHLFTWPIHDTVLLQALVVQNARYLKISFLNIFFYPLKERLEITGYNLPHIKLSQNHHVGISQGKRQHNFYRNRKI